MLFIDEDTLFSATNEILPNLKLQVKGRNCYNIKEMGASEDVKVLKNEQIAPSYFKLTLYSPNISAIAKPGQFVNAKVAKGVIPLLRRPISIHRTDPQNQTFELLYEILGPGTKILSEVKAGDSLNILGPLGNGFKLEKQVLVLVAGGMGIAPLNFLAEETIKQGKEVHLFYGARNKDQIINLDHLNIKKEIATEDGSFGHKGFVTRVLENQLTTYNLPLTTIYSCGPHPMLKAVAEIAKKNKIECQVSLEAYMACGIGACLGCATETICGYKMVCKDGPVFDFKEIKW